MRRHWSVVAVFAAALAACTTSRPLPDAAHADSLIDYLQALRRETSTLLDTVVAATTTPTQETAEYRAWSDHWCPRHTEVHSTEDVIRKVSLVCSQRGGTYVEPYCMQAGTPERVLFFARFRHGIDLCQGVAATVAVEVVEPKSGMTQSAPYLNRLRGYGYRSGGDQAGDALAALNAQEAERARLARELPRLRTRGTRVCRQQDDTLFAGFVEDVSGPKIRITVNDAYYTAGLAKGTRNPNYRPETIWDQPERWTVCD